VSTSVTSWLIQMDIKNIPSPVQGPKSPSATAARTLANPHLDHGITVTLMDIKMDIKTFQALFRGQNRITCPWQYSADPTKRLGEHEVLSSADVQLS